MNLYEYHSKFPGGVRWKVTPQGVDVEGQGLVKYDKAMYARAAALCGKHADAFAASSVKYGVPVELLMACTLTEGAAKSPETCVRRTRSMLAPHTSNPITITRPPTGIPSTSCAYNASSPAPSTPSLYQG